MKYALHMRKVMRSVLCSAAVATAACTFTACDAEIEEAIAPQSTLQTSSENGAIIPGQYIVVFKDNGTLRLNATATYEQRVNAVREMGHELLTANGVGEVAIEQAYGKAIIGVAAKLSEAQVESLKNDPRVDYVEPDRMMVLARPGSGGGGGSTTEETPWGIKRVGTDSGLGKTAWIIDTGIDLDHPDLNVNAGRGFNAFTSGKDGRSADDGNGHGTHVAGTIAAIDNTIGVIGVAAGATVVPVKVLDSRGSGSYSGVIAGVDYVAVNGAPGDVANMSLGGPVSQALDDAVVAAASKGVFFALAAGNDGADANNSSPARAANGTDIFTVSAMNASDIFASFSNYGNPPVNYCAPGVSIKSTWKDGGYNTISGTSMAAPHVAGVLLLTNGKPNTSGFVKSDRDKTPDPIAHK
ncbi:S8 family peptidase [Pontibacter diazotrophicus]|uniref:S8 family peptidase n=1 Tax=Pontibacter diazotrophicus TaxID=1400979 RepID=A0A3D8L3B7_9BACT|nr:S8 family peptidase [Pontibacter diazotrophicus]RDV11979.1 S8 family peptidase [Pontibacter diazotrophicus]